MGEMQQLRRNHCYVMKIAVRPYFHNFFFSSPVVHVCTYLLSFSYYARIIQYMIPPMAAGLSEGELWTASAGIILIGADLMRLIFYFLHGVV